MLARSVVTTGVFIARTDFDTYCARGHEDFVYEFER